MKYVALAVAAAFSGFVGAWLLLQDSLTVSSETTPRATPSIWSSSDEGVGSAARNATLRLAFEDIGSAGTVFDQLYTAWRLAAQTADTATLEQYASRAIASRDPLFSRNIVAIIMERYTAMDPRAAMAFIEREPRLDQISMKVHVLTSWVRHDPEAAIDYMRNTRNRQVLVQSSTLLLQDPVLAATGLHQEVIELIGEERAAQIQEHIDSQRGDPAEMFATATLLRGSERRNRMQTAVSRWMQFDPEAALAAIGSLDVDYERDRMMDMAISLYAQQDPRSAYEYVQLNLPSRHELLVRPIGELASRDIQAALRLAESYEQAHDDTVALSLVLERWTRDDPARALEYTAALPERERRELMPRLAHTYLQQHPAQAMRWLLTLGREFTNVKQSALQIRSNEALQAGEELLPGVTDPAIRRKLIAQISSFKAMQDPESAITWLNAYADEPAYNRALPPIIGKIARHDPARAAEIVDSRINGEDAFGLIHSVAQNWLQQSPAQATRWLASLPNSNDRNNAIMSLSRLAARQSSLESAVDLVELLPEEYGFRQNGANQVALSYADYSPERLDEAMRALGITGEAAQQLRQQLRQQ